MYGVSEDLPLDAFQGHEMNQICLGRFQIQLHWASVGSIYVEGRWELRDASGALEDASQEHDKRDSYQVHRILDVPVARYSVDPPRSFTLHFENGFAFTAYDSDEYESFSVRLDGQDSIYVV